MLATNAREAAAETKKLKEEVVALAKQTPEHRQVVRGQTTGQAATDLKAAQEQLVPLRLAADAAARQAQHFRAFPGLAERYADKLKEARQAWQDQVEKVRE